MGGECLLDSIEKAVGHVWCPGTVGGLNVFNSEGAVRRYEMQIRDTNSRCIPHLQKSWLSTQSNCQYQPVAGSAGSVVSLLLPTVISVPTVPGPVE